MGNKNSEEEQVKKECSKFACAIQDCLKEQNYNQIKCQNELDKYNFCVKSFMEKEIKKGEKIIEKNN
jgi:hypothetical protein